MLKRSTLWAVLLVCAAVSYSQNLISNGGFEEYSECPTDISQIDLAIGWENLGISVDYFNSCCATQHVDVPLNVMGYQFAANGEAYAGLGTYFQDCKEYMQTQLDQPLVPGILTHLSMKVAAGGFGWGDITSPQRASDRVGMRFSMEPRLPFTYYGQFEVNEAPLFATTIVDDTAGWVLISGSFYPDSAYAFLQIGNFFEDDSTDAVILDQTGDSPCAYVFVDDICVAQSEGVCDLAFGLQPALEAIPDVHFVLSDSQLRVIWSGLGVKASRLQLFDGLGREVASTSTVLHAQPWVVTDLTRGWYLLAVGFGNDRSSVFRLLNVSP